MATNDNENMEIYKKTVDQQPEYKGIGEDAIGCVRASNSWTEVYFKKPPSTDSIDVGSSIKYLGIDRFRPLTNGEIEMCKKIFKDSIRYEQVRVVEGIEFEVVFWKMDKGKQKRVINIYVANGFNIYYPSRSIAEKYNVLYRYYRPDFSTVGNTPAAIDLKVKFIHEMTHIWQRNRVKYTLATPVLDEREQNVENKSAGSGIYHIQYDRPPKKDFSLYNHEQQGDLIASYFRFFILNDIPPQYRDRLTYLRAATKRFFQDPIQMSLLPRNAVDRRELYR